MIGSTAERAWRHRARVIRYPKAGIRVAEVLNVAPPHVSFGRFSFLRSKMSSAQYEQPSRISTVAEHVRRKIFLF